MSINCASRATLWQKISIVAEVTFKGSKMQSVLLGDEQNCKRGCQKGEIKYKEMTGLLWPLGLILSKIFLILDCKFLYLPLLEICFNHMAGLYLSWMNIFIWIKVISFSWHLNVWCYLRSEGLNTVFHCTAFTWEKLYYNFTEIQIPFPLSTCWN